MYNFEAKTHRTEGASEATCHQMSHFRHHCPASWTTSKVSNTVHLYILWHVLTVVVTLLLPEFEKSFLDAFEAIPLLASAG